MRAMPMFQNPGWLAVVCVLIHFDGPPAIAGTIEQIANPAMGCTLELSGPIEKGDAEKLRPRLEALHSTPEFRFGDGDVRQKYGRVCLNSTGGSLEAGVALAKMFRDLAVGTAVGRDKTCFSACAVAFMGGSHSYEDDTGQQPDRILHPLGHLGFHAPDLGVPAGGYNETAVKKAYLIALLSVSAVLDIAPEIEFPVSLARLMIGTPSDDMHIIRTVGEAARWRIAIAPVIEPAVFTKKNVVRTCNHFDSAELDQILDYEQQGTTSVTRDADGGWTGEMEDGFRQEGATGCTVSFLPVDDGGAGRTRPSGHGIITGNWRVIWAYQAFDSDTPIASLALTSDSRIEKREAQERHWDRLLRGRCIVFRDQTIVDNDPCEVVSRITRTEDLQETRLDQFTWPSGAKTVVESRPDADGFEVARLNGVDTQRDLPFNQSGQAHRKILQRLAASDGIADAMIVCWPNPASGNRFCFVDSQASTDSLYFRGVEE